MTETVINARQVRGGAFVIKVRGDIGSAAIPELRKALLCGVLRSGCKRVVLDLQGTRHLDAAGIGAVVAADELAVERRVSMVVRGPGSELAGLLRRAGLPRARIQAWYQLPDSHFVHWLV